MEDKDIHRLCKVATESFDVKIVEIALATGINRVQISRWLNNPDEYTLTRENLNKINKRITSLFYENILKHDYENKLAELQNIQETYYGRK